MKDDSPLSPQQEAFVQAYRRNGRNQRQAYFDAYPKSRAWKNVTCVDSAASRLMKDRKVVARLKELDASERDVRKERFDFIDKVLREFVEIGMENLDPAKIRPADIVTAASALARMHGVDTPPDEDE